ncbi:MAG: hypothetical protein V1723_01130 [Candidatus Uhrbacteria bacterium]
MTKSRNNGQRTGDLGLRLLRVAVARGTELTTIQKLRDWNAADGVPKEAVDAAYETGMAEFDRYRNVAER